MAFTNDIAILGGCGHVGLPLGLAFADKGQKVVLIDINAATVAKVSAGRMPFLEDGAEEVLSRVLSKGNLTASINPEEIGTAENIVIVVGTPVDRHLNPDIEAVLRAIEPQIERLVDGQLLVLRSTVYPGVTALVEKRIARLDKHIDVVFCPERIAEGHALEEFQSLPQIISGRTPQAIERATELFRHITPDIIELLPEEAELAKLFTNTWRYIKFATANQLYMIANDFGLDFERIRHAITFKYPRANDMPGAGFAAGPCLFKDTLQLAAFNSNNFTLGNASVMINEGLPLYVVSKLEEKYDLSLMTIGILGMAFKGGSDDTRESLSYKLKSILSVKARRVLCTDPQVISDGDLSSLETVIRESDLLIIATPHKEYANLRPFIPVVDLSNILCSGVRI